MGLVNKPPPSLELKTPNQQLGNGPEGGQDPRMAFQPLTCLRAGHTLGMSHLPVWDVHFPIVPPGKRKGHGVTSSKHAWDVGLHHLWGEGQGSVGATGADVDLQPCPTQHPAHVIQPTLLTGMKPRESRPMPLCRRKPVAGTAPNRTEAMHPHSAPTFLPPHLFALLTCLPRSTTHRLPTWVFMNPTLCAPIRRLCLAFSPRSCLPQYVV